MTKKDNFADVDDHSPSSYPQGQTIVMSADGHLSTVEGERSDVLNYVGKPDTFETLEGSALGAAIESALNRKRRGPTLSLVDAAGSQANPDEDGCFWGNGEEMRSIARMIDQIADCDVTVLLRGESGVGKGLVARALHQRSTRRTAAFVKVNCAALPVDLLESELFGHERGAFTGAVRTHVGKFEQADGGTLLLDEIGELKPALQAKLLHVLQDGEFSKLGSNKHIRANVRVVAATNCNLEEMRASGGFRQDLYFRLGVIELTVPPLRKRRDDFPRLVESFLARCSREYGRHVRPLSLQLRQLFSEYDWPGNVRELENMIKRIVVLQSEQLVVREIQHKLEQRAAAAGMSAATATVAAGMGARVARRAVAGARGADWPMTEEMPVEPSTLDPGARGDRSLVAVAKAAASQAERAAILHTLNKVGWNRRHAAQTLGVSYKTLLNKMKTCGLTHGEGQHPSSTSGYSS